MSEIILHTEALSKHYEGLRANQDVNLQLRQGEIHALIGPNGAGKSTLIAQLAGDLQPTSGRVLLKQRDITHMPNHQRALAGIARSFQVSSIFGDMSIVQNLALAVQAHQGHSYRFWSRAEHHRKINTLAFQLAEQFGLDQQLDDVAGELAHGEQRQLEVAMTLAGQPDVLLLDEPMAGIGPGGSKKLTELLDGLRGQYSMLLVEHDMDAVFSLADRISVLVNGELLMTGSCDEVRNSSAVQQAYLGTGG